MRICFSGTVEQVLHDIINLELRILLKHPLELSDELLVNYAIVNLFDFLDLAPASAGSKYISSTKKDWCLRSQIDCSESRISVVIHIEGPWRENRAFYFFRRRYRVILSAVKGASEFVCYEFVFCTSRPYFNFFEIGMTSLDTKVLRRLEGC